MAKHDLLEKETENKNKGYIISLVIHSLLLLLFFVSYVAVPDPVPSEGILIAFGEPDAGSDDAPEVTEETTEAAAAATPAPAPIKSVSDEVSSKDQTEEAPVKSTPKKTPKPVDTEKLKAKEAADAKAKAKAEADAAAKAEANKKAAEKAKAEKEAADKAAAAANQKKKYSDLLGKGKGNNNTTGNQGTSAGDPDGKALEGISKGTGRVGGGLTGRGVEFSPVFSDNSQKTGKVSLAICVNTEGKVTKADFTQKGSTTSDSYLIEIARKTAMKYKFSKSDIDSQCGNISVDFKVQ